MLERPRWRLVELTPQQEEIQKLAVQLAQEIAPIAAQVDARDEIPREVWQKLSQPPYQFIAPCVPPEYGGRGLGMFELALIMEELAYYSFPIATCVEVTSLTSLVVLNSGSEEQKRRFLSPLVRGEFLMGFALTDEGSGTDVAGMKTQAIKTGDDYVLKGRKRLISMAEIVDAFVLFAKTDPTKRRRSISAFVVPKASPGLRIGRRQKCIGMGGHQTWELVLDDCHVAAENLLGNEGEGFRYALKSLDDSRCTLAAGYVGLARAAFDIASGFALERASFERRLVDNQAVAFPLVELATEIEAARLLAYKAAWLADHKVRHKKETSMSKYFAAELAVKASLLAVSVLGGEGTTTDQPAERYLRDAVTFQFAQGSPQVQRLVVAHELFD